MSDRDRIVVLKGRREKLTDYAEDIAEALPEKRGISISDIADILEQLTRIADNRLVQGMLIKFANRFPNAAKPIDSQANQAKPIEQTNKIPSTAIEPKTEFHGELMKIFNALPEDQIRGFAKLLVGSDQLEDIKKKVAQYTA